MTQRRPKAWFAARSFLAAWATIFAVVARGEAPISLSHDVEQALAARSPTSVEDLRLIQQQLQRVLAKSSPAAVAVQIGRAAGSAVIVDPKGLVLTAAHVVGEAGRRAWITLPDGRRLAGRTLGADHDADAGMIQLDSPPADLPFAPLTEEGELQPGQWVVTIGHPGGLSPGRTPPVRFGRVLFATDEVVCTDCTLVGGDSGGPLLNMQGEVVGIHSSIGPAITHNFHVPATAFRKDWDRLLAGEAWGGRYDDEERIDLDRPLIGVRGRTQDGVCLVTEVMKDLPAEAAGVVAGDVVKAINGRPVTDFDELSRIVALKLPGETLSLTLDRDGDETKVDVILTSLRRLRNERRREHN
jgi:serine protease Do